MCEYDLKIRGTHRNTELITVDAERMWRSRSLSAVPSAEIHPAAREGRGADVFRAAAIDALEALRLAAASGH